MIHPFSLPAVNYYGKGALMNLGSELEKNIVKKVFLISDKGLKSSGILDQVHEQLDKTEVIEYVNVEREPSVENVEDALREFKISGCDAVIGVGGGSPLDVAKGVSVMANNKGSLLDYVGVQLIPNPGVFNILIPTTAGTGAEITQNAIFTDRSAKMKKGIVSRHLIPNVAIVDSNLTISVPAAITAATGMDALTHAIESYTAPKANVQTEMYAIKSIELIGQHLRTAVSYGKDEAAREAMALASVFAGISLANAGVGAVHAMAYPLGGRYGVNHGIANATLLPYVMEFNVLGNMQKFKNIAIALGESSEGKTDRETAFLAVKAVKRLSRDVGIPQTLTELGVDKGSVDAMAEGAMQATRLIDNNPRQIGVEDIKAIFNKMFEA